ncbi:MAG: hypothetical protein CR991_03915 [Proteobacteria bacterium]|nr:MAG: hypothetical protein CR991_03915 [Pseudomonadota bacterium]
MKVNYWRQHGLLLRGLVQRDMQERYRGTCLGILWLLIQPLFLLMLYTLVFGEILQLRFTDTASTPIFAFYLFAGLLVFNAFSEVLNRAPSLLPEQRDLLLNTPLSPWLLPLLPVGTSILLEWFGVLILLLGAGIGHHFEPWGLLLYWPYFLLRVLLSTAAAYTCAVLGVFLRDLRQLVPALLSILLFLSPIFYPLERIPERFQFLYHWNVLGQLVQGYRESLLEGVFVWQRFAGLWVVAVLSLSGALWLFHSLMPKARLVL